MNNSADMAVVDDVKTYDFPVGFGFMGPPPNATLKYPMTILLLFSFFHNFVAAIFLVVFHSSMMSACPSWPKQASWKLANFIIYISIR